MYIYIRILATSPLASSTGKYCPDLVPNALLPLDELTLGVSGAVCNFGIVSIGTTALAMIIGIILMFIGMKINKEEKYMQRIK